MGNSCRSELDFRTYNRDLTTVFIDNFIIFFNSLVFSAIDPFSKTFAEEIIYVLCN